MSSECSLYPFPPIAFSNLIDCRFLRASEAFHAYSGKVAFYRIYGHFHFLRFVELDALKPVLPVIGTTVILSFHNQKLSCGSVGKESTQQALGVLVGNVSDTICFGGLRGIEFHQSGSGFLMFRNLL